MAYRKVLGVHTSQEDEIDELARLYEYHDRTKDLWRWRLNMPQGLNDCVKARIERRDEKRM